MTTFTTPPDAGTGHATAPPSPWIARFAPLVAPGATVLDLACGRGRHARLFAGRGCRVLAVDRDPVALTALAGVPGVATRQADLEGADWPLAGLRFDAIVVTNYLFRRRLADLVAMLAPDGVLLYETFARGNEAFGRPSNPEFLVGPGELLALAADHALTVVAFEQGRVDGGGRAAVLARLCAVGPARHWPPMLAE